jgi:hypothetical protein
LNQDWNQIPDLIHDLILNQIPEWQERVERIPDLIPDIVDVRSL